MSYFVENDPALLKDWDGKCCCETIPGRPDWRKLLWPIPCGDEWIEVGFEWNGASVGPLRMAFPKWKHPIATCRHDKRCEQAKTWAERSFARREFYKDVGIGGTKWEQIKGVSGVYLGDIWWFANRTIKGVIL